jgi:glycosyltransferase involved in cell wall biosynthesis
MGYDIIIPTCKKRHEIDDLLSRISKTAPSVSSVIATCMPASASVNRNYGIYKSNSDYIVMVDDDISGFFCGWADILVDSLACIMGCCMVSARLMDSYGTPGIMMSHRRDIIGGTIIVDPGYLPSACVAFRRDGTRFDENFIGSGWEDTDFCDSLHVRYPYGVFAINNDVRLIHANERKNGNDSNFEINKQYYLKKHGRIL